MSAPLIEFAQFARPQRWWLRRGPPPWLDDRRWFARAFRASLVLGLMGTVTGWLTVISGLLLKIIEGYRWNIPNSELVVFLGPGLCLGLGVLVPMSRWLGRRWIFTVLAVPLSMFASYCGFVVFLSTSSILSSHRENELGGIYAGFTGAVILAIWMGHPLRISAWLAGLAAATLASLHCGVFFQSPPETISPNLPGELTNIIEGGWLYVGFQSLTAVGLGIRLWMLQEPRTK